MSTYSKDVLADHLVINSGSKTTADALGKAYQLGGQVLIKMDPGGGTKRYFGLVRLLNGVGATAQDGDYLLRDEVTGQYTEVINATQFTVDYTLVDESS